MATVTYKYYTDTYGGSLIPESSFTKVSNDAMQRILVRTMWRASTAATEEYADDLKKCTCEVAENLYQKELARGDNGVALASYSNDGESGTLDVGSMSDDSVAVRIEDAINKWLFKWGLTYTGGALYA